jgi:hypothetical protein
MLKLNPEMNVDVFIKAGGALKDLKDSASLAI